MDAKRTKPSSAIEIFGQQTVTSPTSNNNNEEVDKEEELLDKESKWLDKLLLQETMGCGHPKALCYEDILLMVVCHPATHQDTLAIAIKFIHHKGCDNNQGCMSYKFLSRVLC